MTHRAIRRAPKQGNPWRQSEWSAVHNKYRFQRFTGSQYLEDAGNRAADRQGLISELIKRQWNTGVISFGRSADVPKAA